MKHIRHDVYLLLNVALANRTAPEGYTDTCDRVLSRVRDLNDAEAWQPMLARIHYAAHAWADGESSDEFGIDIRSELTTRLDDLYIMLGNVYGMPSYYETRDEWSDIVEDG